jgi:hypothetical protein
MSMIGFMARIKKQRPLIIFTVYFIKKTHVVWENLEIFKNNPANNQY